MSVTLVISIYKDYLSLERVLETVYAQSIIPSQVILAHDTIDDDIQSTILPFEDRLSLTYINQEDTGFNKNRILNKAVLQSKNEKIVFIDGDCILHKQFIQSHAEHLEQGFYTAGRRVDLDAKTTSEIKNKGASNLGFWKMFSNKTKRIEEAIYLPFHSFYLNKPVKLIGCNMGWCKKDLLALNGFDMDYMHPGFGEDTDLEFRANLLGLKSKNLRWKAIEYHLDHNRPEREIAVNQSKNLFESKKEIGYYFCENGVNTLYNKFPHE